MVKCKLFRCLVLFTILNLPDSSFTYKPSRQYNDRRFFIQEIFSKYGDGSHITFEGFEHLLENLGLGQLEFREHHEVEMHKVNGTFKDIHDELGLHVHDHNETRRRRNLPVPDISAELKDILNDHNEHKDEVSKRSRKTCLSPQDMLITYGLKPHHEVMITPVNFIHLCPVIVYELDNRSCYPAHRTKTFNHFSGGNEISNHVQVWLYASCSILIMSGAGLLLIFVIPVTRTRCFKPLIQFLMSLAVGTLTGDALLHLLPHALAYNVATESETTAVLRSSVVFGAFTLFFIIESCMKIAKTKKTRAKDKTRKRAIVFDLETNVSFQDKDTKMKETTGRDTDEDVEDSHMGHSHQHSHHVNNDQTIAWIVIMGDILHNITDGLSIGAAFASSITSGITSSIAILCHELPHELGDYAILLRSGMSIKKSMLYNCISSIFSFIGMAIGIYLGEIDTASLWINSFTAGSFLYIALADLIPEMKFEQQKKFAVGTFLLQLLGVVMGGLLMLAIALYEDDFEKILQ